MVYFIKYCTGWARLVVVCLHLKKSAFERTLENFNSLDILGLHLIQTTIAENSFSFFFQYPPNINF